MSEQETFYCQVGEHTVALEAYGANYHTCGHCHRVFCPEHRGYVRVRATGDLLSCKDHVAEVRRMNDQNLQMIKNAQSHPLAETTSRTIPTSEVLKQWYDGKVAAEQEVATLKQLVHHLVCLLDDCKLELAGIKKEHPEWVDKDLLDKVIDVCDVESKEEKAWYARPTIDDPAILQEIQDIIGGAEDE